MRLYEAAQDGALIVELREFFHENLRELALEKVFAREDTSGIADAKDAIDKVFESIELQFQNKVEPKQIVNEAR